MLPIAVGPWGSSCPFDMRSPKRESEWGVSQEGTEWA